MQGLRPIPPSDTCVPTALPFLEPGKAAPHSSAPLTKARLPGYQARRASIPMAGALPVGLAVARAAARAAAPAAAPSIGPTTTNERSPATARRSTTPPTSAAAPRFSLPDHGAQQTREQGCTPETALHGSRVPSLPVFGFMLPSSHPRCASARGLSPTRQVNEPSWWVTGSKRKSTSDLKL